MKYVFATFTVLTTILFLTCVAGPPIIERASKQSSFVLNRRIEDVRGLLRKEDTIDEIMAENGIEVLSTRTVDKDFKLKRLRRPIKWEFQSESISTIRMADSGMIMKVRQYVAANPEAIKVKIILDERNWAISDFVNTMYFERYEENKTLVSSYIYVEANPNVPRLSVIREMTKQKVVEGVNQGIINGEKSLKDVLVRKQPRVPLFNWRR